MRWRALASVTVAVVVAALAAGCPGKVPTVSGDVTLDGQPLADGTITYVPADPKLPKVERKITDGKYSAPLPLGAYKVQVSAVKPTGKKRQMLPESPPVDIMGESIPERYNANTELQTEIKAGDTERNWPLKSK